MTYILTDGAKQDLEDIYEYGAANWGKAKAVEYQYYLLSQYSYLAENSTALN